MSKAVLFDMDGVLLNTEPVYTEVYQAICQNFGKAFTDEIKSQIMGSAERKAAEFVIQTLELPISPEAFLDQKKTLIIERFRNVDALPGAEALVESLKASNVPIAVATSSSQPMFEIKTAKHNWFSHFDAIITGDTVEHAKPAPDIFLKAANALGVAPEDCLVFEDSLNGVEAALAANMSVIAVPMPEFAHHFKQPGLVVLPNLHAFLPTCWELP